jgi:hypothetical protein
MDFDKGVKKRSYTGSKNKTKQTITVAEAIEQGYKYFNADGYENVGMLADYHSGQNKQFLLEQMDRSHKYWLIDKEPTYFKITGEEVCEAICDLVDNQEDFYDDDMVLNGMVCDVYKENTELFASLCSAINEKFGNKKFYNPLNIEVVFPDKPKKNDCVDKNYRTGNISEGVMEVTILNNSSGRQSVDFTKLAEQAPYLDEVFFASNNVYDDAMNMVKTFEHDLNVTYISIESNDHDSDYIDVSFTNVKNGITNTGSLRLWKLPFSIKIKVEKFACGTAVWLNKSTSIVFNNLKEKSKYRINLFYEGFVSPAADQFIHSANSK